MYAEDMRVFKVDDGETHWVVAKTAEEAIEAVTIEFGFGSVAQYRSDMNPSCEPVFHADLITVGSGDDEESASKEAREWAIEKRGVFASTVE